MISKVLISHHLNHTHNKAFKADSQRVAFSVQIEFCVYGVLVYVGCRRRSLLNAALDLLLNFVVNCICIMDASRGA